MLLELDKEINLSPKVDTCYVISSHHRKYVNDKKSRWVVSMQEEIDCFVNACTAKWFDYPTVWGIIKQDSHLIKLGESKLNSNLKLAKFVENQNNWHGYPADYVRNNQDRPGTVVLAKWRKDGIIEKHHIIKIRKGVECNL
jgi:hypothetical protein